MSDSLKYGIFLVFCLFVAFLVYLYFSSGNKKTASNKTVVTPPPQVNPPVTPPPIVALSPMEKYLQNENNNIPEMVAPLEPNLLRITDPIDLSSTKMNKEILLGFNSPNAMSNLNYLSALFFIDKKTGKKHIFINKLIVHNYESKRPSADRFMLVDAGAGQVYIKHVKSGFYLSLVQVLDNMRSRPELSGPVKILTLVENPHDEKWTIKNTGDKMYKLIYKTGEEMSESYTGVHDLFGGKYVPRFIGYSNYDAWMKKNSISAENIPELNIIIL